VIAEGSRAKLWWRIAGEIRESDCGMEDSPMSVPNNEVVLQAAVSVLEELGPFAEDARRSQKWRTADQLAAELRTKLHPDVSAEQITAILSDVHRSDVEAVNRGEKPTSPVRRASRPDLTTTQLLWGSTRHLGYVWKGFPADARIDRPEDFGDISSAGAKYRVFVSYCHADSVKARDLATVLAKHGIACWMAELNVNQGEDIVTAVREALHESDALVAFVTRRFVGSLWCRTELHTALHGAYPTLLVLDAADRPLVELMASRSTATEPDGGEGAMRFGSRELSAIATELAEAGDYESAEEYIARAQGFAHNLPDYLGGRSFVSCAGAGAVVDGLRAIGLEV